MSYGQPRNTGIVHLRNYEEALSHLENGEPIRGKGANAGRIPLGHRHRTAEFYIEMNEDKSIDCMCYRTPVVSFKPDGNIVIQNGGWTSITTCQFIEEVLAISSRISDSTVVVSFYGGDYKVANELCIKRVENSWGEKVLVALNQEPSYVHRVNRKQANIVRKEYAEFTKYFTGVMKLREGGLVLDDEYINLFGKNNPKLERADFPNDISLRCEAEVNMLIDMMQSKDSQKMYEASLRIVKQFGKRHYWKNMGFSLQPQSIKKAMDNLIFAKHKDIIFDSEEVPVGTIKKDLWGHLFN
jgi:hypothetical protein